MAGRREARSPWQEREAALRNLGRIRKAIAEDAVEGRLPDLETRGVFRELNETAQTAHQRWVASRA